MPLSEAQYASEGGHRTARVPLRLWPCTLAEANAFVAAHHRHALPVVGHKWSVACVDGERVCGVAIIGRPIARHLDDGLTVEILRVATDGTRNACTMLEGAACRAAFAQGYRRVVTYTRKDEPGASLRAAGFRVVGEVKGRQWDCASRPRVRREDTPDRLRWERSLTAAQHAAEAQVGDREESK